MKQQITVTVNGKPTLAVCGISVSELIGGEKPCGGHGKCGKCKVIAHGVLSPLSASEKQLLTPSEIDQGVRLACCTYALGDCTVSRFDSGNRSDRIVTDSTLPQFACDPAFEKYGAAKGGYLALRRILRCNPLFKGGYDPVP